MSTSTGNNTTTGTAVTVYAGESGTISEVLSNAANYNATLACTGNATALSGNTLTINPADTAITCTQTNTRRSATLTLRKVWSNARVGETATVTSSGFGNNASSGLSTSTGNNTTTGTSVTVYAGESGTISEVLSNAANYNATLACTGNATALSGNTLTINPADTAITCTQTNTRRSATLTLRKVWSNARVGETATVTSSGFGNNASSGLSTSTGNNTTTGTSVTVYAGETGTISEVLSNAANYTATLACTGNGTALSGNTLTINPADTAITCTQTNTRRSATLTLVKTWSNARVGETATVTSSGFGNNASSGLSTSTGNNTTTGTSVTVYAGETGTISEVLSNAANYTATLACTGATDTNPTDGLTIDAADTAITCTQTNTRKSATLTLVKTWANAVISDSVTVSATGLTSLSSTANAANETDTGAAQTVYAGEVITLAENFTSGSAGNYNRVLTCSGNTQSLAGNALTVDPADTTVTCTWTNTFMPQVYLTVTKISQGRTGSFNFSGTNGYPGDVLVTTATGNPVSGTRRTLTATGVATSGRKGVP